MEDNIVKPKSRLIKKRESIRRFLQRVTRKTDTNDSCYQLHGHQTTNHNASDVHPEEDFLIPNALEGTTTMKNRTTYIAVLEDVPTLIWCRFCNTQVTTQVISHSKTKQKWSRFALFLFLGLFCVWIPILLDDMKDIFHKCPNCEKIISPSG